MNNHQKSILEPSPNRVACAIREGFIWLEKKQKRDGRWKEETRILELTTTSQAAQVFIQAGFDISDRVLRKSINWLIGEKITLEITHRFWRLLPLVNFGDMFREYIISDFSHLIDSIEKGLKIDARLSYQAFLLECLHYSSIQLDINISDHLCILKNELEKSCKVDSLKAIWVCAILELMGENPSNDVVNSITKTIMMQVHTRNTLSNFNNNVSETSYCLINLIRSPSLIKRNEIVTIVNQCASWLLTKQENGKGYWNKEQSLYGGNLSSSYTTSVAMRAIIEYLKWRDCKSLGNVYIKDWRRVRNFQLWRKVMLIFLCVVCFVVLFILIALYFSEFIIWFTIITGLAGLAGLIPLFRDSD